MDSTIAVKSYTCYNLAMNKKVKRKAIFVDEDTHKQIADKAGKEHRTLAAQLKHDYQKRPVYSQAQLQAMQTATN